MVHIVAAGFLMFKPVTVLFCLLTTDCTTVVRIPVEAGLFDSILYPKRITDSLHGIKRPERKGYDFTLSSVGFKKAW
jgi:hypothetical protein